MKLARELLALLCIAQPIAIVVWLCKELKWLISARHQESPMRTRAKLLILWKLQTTQLSGLGKFPAILQRCL